MQFENPPEEAIHRLLLRARTLAVVGLSGDPGRTSHAVSAAMQRFGYRVIPVNPAIDQALGETAVGTLAEARQVLAAGEQLDIVNVFRRPGHVAGIVDECLELGLPALWLQEGVIDVEAARRALDAGMLVVMDRCILKVRARMTPG